MQQNEFQHSPLAGPIVQGPFDGENLDERPYLWTYIISDTRHSNNTKRLEEIENSLEFSLVNKPLSSTLTNGDDLEREDTFLTLLDEQQQTHEDATSEAPKFTDEHSLHSIEISSKVLTQHRSGSAESNMTGLVSRSDSLKTWEDREDTQTPENTVNPDASKSASSEKVERPNSRRKRTLKDREGRSTNNEQNMEEDGNLTKIRLAVKAGMWTKSDENRMKERYSQVREAIGKLCAKRNIKTQILTTEKQSITVHYHDQGNIDMYSDENIRKRNEIREDPTVSTIIRHWWEATIKMKGDESLVSKMTYMSLTMAIYTALMPDNAGKTLEDARRNAEKDWRVDSRGYHNMNYSLFYDAVFEVADIWCESTEKKEYILFLDILFQKVFLDDTLPKIIRKHINQQYVDRLTNKKKIIKEFTHPFLSAPERKKKRKKRNHLKPDKPIVPKKILQTSPRKAPFKSISANKSPKIPIREGKATHKPSTKEVIKDEKLLDPVIEVLFQIPPPIEKVYSVGELPIDSVVQMVGDDSIQESSEEPHGVGHSETPKSRKVIAKNTIAQNPELDAKVVRIIDNFRSDNNIRQSFLSLLMESDKFVLERTILNRLISNIKGGYDVGKRENPILGILNHSITGTPTGLFRKRNGINPQDLLGIFKSMNIGKEENSNSATEALSKGQGGGPCGVRKFVRKNSLTHTELMKEKEEFLGQKFMKRENKEVDTRHGLSQHTWSKLLQFAEDLIRGSVTAPDAGKVPNIDKPPSQSNHLSEDALNSLEYSSNSTSRSDEEFIEEIENHMILEDSRRSNFERLFEEGEQLRRIQVPSLSQLNTSSSDHFTAPVKESTWSAYDFFHSHFKGSSLPNTARSDTSSINMWWEKNGSSSTTNDSLRTVKSSPSTFRADLAFDQVIEDPWTKDGDVETLDEVIKRFTKTTNSYNLRQKSSSDIFEYKLSKKDQMNILVLKEEKISEHSTSRTSWIPKTNASKSNLEPKKLFPMISEPRSQEASNLLRKAARKPMLIPELVSKSSMFYSNS